MASEGEIDPTVVPVRSRLGAWAAAKDGGSAEKYRTHFRLIGIQSILGEFWVNYREDSQEFSE